MTPETCRICLAKEPRRSLESHASTKQLASTPRRSPLPYQRAVTAARARARAHTLGSAPGAARRAPGCCSRAGVRAPAPRTAGCSARPRGRRRRPPGTRPPPAARACAPPGLRARRHKFSARLRVHRVALRTAQSAIGLPLYISSIQALQPCTTTPEHTVGICTAASPGSTA